jgi:predicted ATP-grasp superfamily ATP-dependent carboligase
VRALIIEDGLSRQALAAARALNSTGWTVGIGSPGQSSVAAASRAVAAWHPVASPSDGIEEFERDVGVAIESGGYEVVFGARDTEIASLAALRDRLPARVAHPDSATVEVAQDKLELARIGAEAGFAVPKTAPAHEGALAGGAVIVKPRVGPALARAIASGSELPARADAVVAADAAELRAAIAATRAAGDEPLVQERLEGDLIALVVLADRDGSVVAGFQQRAERTWPLNAGISVRARVVEPDPTLAEHAAAIVAGLGWSGLAQLQLIQPAAGEPRLIDFNGRFYGSLALAGAAGCDVTSAWARGALEGTTPDPGTARPGTRYQWAWGDLRRATQERRGGLVRDVAGVARYAPGATHSVFALRDPRPAARYLRIALARSRARRGLERAEPE